MLSAEPWVPKFLWSGKFPLPLGCYLGTAWPFWAWVGRSPLLHFPWITQLCPKVLHVHLSHLDAIHLFPALFCPIMFLPSQTRFTYGLLGVPFQFSLLSDNLHSQYQISEKDSLLWQPVSDGIEIYFQTRQVHRSVSLQTGSPWVRRWLLMCCLSPHTCPPTLCSVSPLGLGACKRLSQTPLPTGLLWCCKHGRQRKDSIKWNKDKICL